MDSIQQEYLELVNKVNQYSHMYYNDNNSPIPDQAFDYMVKRIEDIERMYPHLKVPNSPTNKVGAPVGSLFRKVQHEVPMLSLDNMYDYNELDTFFDIKRGYPEIAFVAEPKLDGVAFSIIYLNGMPVRAATRGDGYTGEDMTHTLPFIHNIPAKIPVPGKVEIRGEILLPLDNFKRINAERRAQGESEFTHPRNVASGTLRQLNMDILKSRGLQFFAYQMIGSNLIRQSDVLEYLTKIGFSTAGYTFIDKDNYQKVLANVRTWNTNHNIALDGVVIKINNIDLYNQIGSGNKYPKYAKAYKFPAETQDTQIIEIIHQVGKTGKITPVAKFIPVILGGARVQYATLHNYEDIKRKGIWNKDFVEVTKSAEIIPYILRSYPERRTGVQTPIEEPRVCPNCKSPVVRGNSNHGETSTSFYCTNEYCTARVKASINTLVSRDVLGINGIGDKIVDKLVDTGLINKPSDILTINEFSQDMWDLLGVSQKLATKIVDSYDESKGKTTFAKLITALGIPLVGAGVSKLLSRAFPSLDALSVARVDELTSIDGIGQAVAENIVTFLNRNSTKEMIKKLKEAGYKTENPVNNSYVNLSNPMFDTKVFVITGAFANYTRDDIVNIITSRNGIVRSSVSKMTDYVIAGDNAGSKLDKAKELSIEILNEEEFTNMLRYDAK